MVAGFSFCSYSDFLNLIRKKLSRNVGHCTDCIGFVLCNYWRSVIFPETNLLFVEICATDFKQEPIPLKDWMACSRKFSQSTN